MVLLLAVALLATIVSTGTAQVAAEKELTVRMGSDARILVGQNSTDSKMGAHFAGAVGYGVGYGITIFVESGYGWTNYQSVDGLRFVEIPVLGGLTFNFGTLLKSNAIQPYIGASAGVFNYLLQQDWNTLRENGKELKTTNFGIEGIAGVKFMIPNSGFGVDLRANFDHAFSKRDAGNSLEKQEWSNTGGGLGISYNFSL
jgi:hypothetical protein